MSKKSNYDNQYAKEHYDRIILQVPKGEKDKIIKYGNRRGYKHLNAYILSVLYDDMYEQDAELKREGYDIDGNELIDDNYIELIYKDKSNLA